MISEDYARESIVDRLSNFLDFVVMIC